MERRRCERYMVHDELIYELYNLKTDTIQYQIINGVPYLVNIAKGKLFEIGFRVKLNESLDSRVSSGTYINQINAILNEGSFLYLDYEEQLIDKYGDRLCLTNIEKYILNILFDKYLDNPFAANISLKEIEIMYREMALSKRYIVLNSETYSRYMLTIDLLRNKELYISTKKSFRNSCYGCNNITMIQKLLSITNYAFDGTNNLKFNYSLGILGQIIRNCKRYSTLAPAKYFRVNLNQVKRNLIAMYISRKVFVERYVNSYKVNPDFMFELNVGELTNFIEEPLKPIKSNYARYNSSIMKTINDILNSLKENGEIDYEIIEESYSYLDKLTDKELVREEWFNELSEFHGEKKERYKTSVTTTINIFIGEPTLEYELNHYEKLC